MEGGPKFMAKGGVLILATNCTDPAREDEYRRWYLDHIGDVLDVPGMVSGQLYENPAPKEGEARYTAVYQIEGDPDAVVAAMMARVPQWREQGKLIDYTG